MSRQKKDGRGHHPSFGVTPTLAIGDLFAWRRPYVHEMIMGPTHS